MLKSVRSLLAASVLATAAFGAVPAFAQEESAPITISGSAAIVSQYRFRGVDLSGGNIAVQGGITASHESGFYVGTWGSSLDEDTVGYGHTELDLYGGFKTEVGAVTLDVGMTAYLYPDAGAGNFDVYEFYGKAGFAIGPASATLGVAYAPSQDSLDFGGPRDNLYLSGDLGVGIPGSPITLLAHLGYTDGALTYTADSNAFDWSLGASVAVPGTPLSLGAAYVGADGTGNATYDFVDDAVVFTLTASF